MRPVRIGIDLGSRAIKVAWTTSHGGEFRWHHRTQSRDPSDTPAQLARLLHELLRPLRRSRYRAPVALAISQSHLRQLTLQVEHLKHLSQAVQEQLPRLFPFDVARLRWCSRLTQRQMVAGTLSCTVQVAACDAEALAQDVGCLQRAGWLPSHAYPAAYAMVALAKAQGALAPQGTTLLMDIGAKHLLLVLVSDGQLLMAREVALGSDYVTEALTSQLTVGQQTLQLSWEEAEQLKCAVGIPEATAPSPEQLVGGRVPLATYQAMVQPVLEQWQGELQRTIAFCGQTHPEAIPQRLLVSGGGAQLIGFDRWLTKQLDIPVQRLSVRPFLGDEAPGLAITCGLLLAEERAGVDLLPEPVAAARRVVKLERALIAVTLLAVVGVGLVTTGTVRQRQALERQLAPMQQRWRALEPVRQLANHVASREVLIDTLVRTGTVPADWLASLREEFPSPVRLTHLSVDGNGSVRMVGQAEGREQTPEAYVSEFAMWLERAGVCRGVRLGSSQRHGGETDLVDFNLTCQRL